MSAEGVGGGCLRTALLFSFSLSFFVSAYRDVKLS